MAGEDEALFQKGMPIRREVLGPAYGCYLGFEAETGSTTRT
jgi:hypothetical protein